MAAAVGNSASRRGEVKHDLGTIQRALSIFESAQVKLGAARYPDIGWAHTPCAHEMIDESRTDKSRTAGHDDGTAGVEFLHQSTLPIHWSRLAANHSTVARTPSSQVYAGAQPVRAASLL